MGDPAATITFDTAIGPCAVAWADGALTGVRIGADGGPGAASAVPPFVRDAVDGIGALLRGEPADLTQVPLALDRVPEFDAGVYAVARAIAPGATLTYGEMAARLGAPGAAQAVGRALGRNPWPLVVPCHRVLAAGGDGGFSAPGGVVTKRRLLAIEGALALFDADALA